MHPIAFQLGPLTIHWYGVMIALAFLAGLWTATLRARRENIPGEKIADVSLWLMVGAILGARVRLCDDVLEGGIRRPAVLGNFHDPARRPGLLRRAHRRGARRLHLHPLEKTAAVENRRRARAEHRAGQRLWPHRLPAQRLLLRPRRPICRGPSRFTNPQAHELSGTPLDVPVHPTEIYDALLNFVLYLFLAWLFRRKKFDGQVFATYLIGYAITRSIMEYFRGDYPPDHIHFGLTPGNWSASRFSSPASRWRRCSRAARAAKRG